MVLLYLVSVFRGSKALKLQSGADVRPHWSLRLHPGCGFHDNIVCSIPSFSSLFFAGVAAALFLQSGLSLNESDILLTDCSFVFPWQMRMGGLS